MMSQSTLKLSTLYQLSTILTTNGALFSSFKELTKDHSTLVSQDAVVKHTIYVKIFMSIGGFRQFKMTQTDMIPALSCMANRVEETYPRKLNMLHATV